MPTIEPRGQSLDEVLASGPSKNEARRARVLEPVSARWSHPNILVLAAGAALATLLAGMVSWLATAPTGAVDANVSRLAVCLAIMATALVGYVQWPSRWNLLAHTQFAFSLFAYVVPTLVFDPTETVNPSTWAALTRMVVVGAVFAALGAAASGYSGGALTRMAARLGTRVGDASERGRLERRIGLVLTASLCALMVCFVVMGFVPALADDPFAAKFFRGAYAESYRPVAPLYRISTALLALLLPAAAYYAWRVRTIRWVALFVGCVGAMLLTLQRGPALGGVLLFAGVLAAKRRARMPLYLLSLVAVYFLGSAVYSVLNILGVEGYGFVEGTDLLRSAANGAPDVADSLLFLDFWLADPELTMGRTFWGGLVPSNFEWNPSVWTLTVTNPGAAVTTISSGGFRLPVALWGMVAFGWPGLMSVCLLHGWVMGRLARSARRVLPSASTEATVAGLIIYGAAIDLLARFYAVSYMTVIEVAVLWAILFAPSSSAREARAPSAPAGGGARGAPTPSPGATR